MGRMITFIIIYCIITMLLQIGATTQYMDYTDSDIQLAHICTIILGPILIPILLGKILYSLYWKNINE